VIVLVALAACLWALAVRERSSETPAAAPALSESPASLTFPGEGRLANIRQLTFGGQNAEAYFSADDRHVIFQHSGQFYDPRTGDPAGENVACDQQYIVAVDPTGAPAAPRRVSNGQGRTTCGYFFPSGERVLYASTFGAGAACPPPPDYSQGYVWAIYEGYKLYSSRADGGDIRPLAHGPGYNAEATISRDGRQIVFTSTRNGDLDIYVMNADGSGVRQLTRELGYDGGPFFSYDGRKIVYRAEHPQEPERVQDYRALLGRGLIRPGNLEIWTMNADGGGKRQVTKNGAANFAPYWLPDGRQIIFSSNAGNSGDPSGFDLFLINEDGTGLEPVTAYPGFDSFPMFSSDGKRLVWASNRNGRAPRETNIFIADWVE
jgi:Tol biopolymer transport system component